MKGIKESKRKEVEKNRKEIEIYLKTFFAIIAFGFCVFFYPLSLGLGFCMPVGHDEVNLGLIDFYRPIINQLPVDSGWVYLFDHFEELRSVIQTCRRGQLLGAEETYDFIQLLYPMQLQSLLNSLLDGFGFGLRNNTPEITIQCVVISRELLEQSTNCIISLSESTNCIISLSEIAENISVVRGLDISNQPLEQSFPALVRELNFPYFYATQILLTTERLYAQYARLFALLV